MIQKLANQSKITDVEQNNEFESTFSILLNSFNKIPSEHRPFKIRKALDGHSVDKGVMKQFLNLLAAESQLVEIDGVLRNGLTEESDAQMQLFCQDLLKEDFCAALGKC